MNCTQAAECVSALFDSHQISREVAAHLADCHECRVRLNEYAEMGAELRDLSSAAAPQAVPEGRWRLAEPAPAKHWLRKWRGTMRIPRFAFALMVVAIFVLSGGLALVKARPGGNGPVLWLMFKVPPRGEIQDCTVRTDDNRSCGFFKGDVPGQLSVNVRVIKREGERVLLGIKADFVPPASSSSAEADRMPEEEYWFERDKPLSIQVAGLGPIEVSGEFLDYTPAIGTNPRESLDPAQNEFRFLSPVLLRNNRVLFSLAGFSATGTGYDPAVILYSTRLGRFIFSPVSFQGAIEGRVQGSQISFTLEGKQYLLLTGAPITRSERAWVLYQPDWRPPTSEPNASPIGSTGSLQDLLKREP